MGTCFAAQRAAIGRRDMFIHRVLSAARAAEAKNNILGSRSKNSILFRCERALFLSRSWTIFTFLRSVITEGKSLFRGESEMTGTLKIFATFDIAMI